MGIAFPDAVERIEAAHEKGILKQGGWGNGTEAVCMMSAFVPGARGHRDCVTAGWPGWLARLNVSLFDAEVGAEGETKEAYKFALGVARAVAVPRDYDKALKLFLIARLETGDHSALKSLDALDGKYPEQREAILSVVALLRRSVEGENVESELRAAGAAARAAARRDLIAALEAA